MVQRSLLLVALIALLSCAASLAQEEEVNFVRPNEAEECGEPIDFMAYAEGLANTNCGEEQCEYQEQAATLFDLKYRKDYKVIEYKTSPEVEGEIVEVDGEPTQGTAATYILYPCGLEEPNDEWIQERIEANISEILFVEIPVTAAVTDDSTIGWMLEELGVLDRVRYGPEAATSPCLQKIVDSEEDDGCGRLFNASYTAEPTNTTEFDIEFGFLASPAAKGVIFQASADPGPLARAEHVMYLSTFFNKEAVASDWYKQVSDSYGEKAEAVEAAEAPPTVAWVSHVANGSEGFQVGPDGEPLPGPVTTFSFARYKALLTRDAGGALQVQGDVVNITNAFASNDDVKLAAALFPSEAVYNEAVLSVLAGVDILIDENFVFDPTTLDTTVDEILGQLGLNGTDVDPALYPFIGNENIWRHDKARSEDGNDEWFGEAVARPDLVHSDLQEMITPGSLENHTFKFFRNMYSGENVTSLGPESCTLACDAWEKQEPLIFSEAASNGTEAEGTEGTDAEDTEGEENVTEDEDSPASHSAVAAGVVIATTILASMI